MAAPPNSVTPEKTIMVQRVIWGTLLLGPLFYGMVNYLVLQKQAKPAPANADILTWIGAAALLIIPVVFSVRAMQFRKARVDGLLPVGVYGTGNIIYWAGCEGATFFLITMATARQSIWPTYLMAGVAMALQALVFPRLSAIRARPDRFQIE